MTAFARVTALVIPLIAWQLQAQTPVPQPIFRGGTDLVRVDVSVLDNHRRPVRGLNASDFTILEDGQPREILAFSEVRLPDRVQTKGAAWTREVPSDVISNQIGLQEGRLVVILLDRSIPVGEPTVTARRIAAAAIDQLGPGDLAAVVSTSNGAVQNLTSDRARLMRTLTESDLSTDISEVAKGIEADIFALTGRTWSTLNDPRCQCGLCVLETITRVADAVQDSARRKMLFFIGSDLLLQYAGPAGGARQDVGCEKRLRDARDTMFTAVDRANLTIHSLDPLGLVNPGSIMRASSPLRGVQAGPDIGTAIGANQQRLGTLQVLPDRTGGRAVLNTNGPDGEVPQIFRESDSYYVIGFRPGDPSPNGKSHEISVRTKRRGLDVHARSGYTAPTTAERHSATTPAATVSEPVRAALTGLLPAAASSIDLNAATFAIPGAAKGAVVLTVGVGDFASSLADAVSAEGIPLEVVATAFDRGGRPKGIARQTLQLSLPASGLAPDRRFDALSRLDLPPGDYEIRVAVSSNDSSRTASVFSYITVPAYESAPLSVSNIVLAATASTLTAPKDFVSSLLPIVPTGRREFARTGQLVAFFRIYQGVGRDDALGPVALRSSIVDAQNKVVASEASVLDEGQFANGRTAEHFLALPLSGLAPGEYLVKVETTLGTRTAGRVTRFVVK
jgi:VWFA-related protein